MIEMDVQRQRSKPTTQIHTSTYNETADQQTSCTVARMNSPTTELQID